MVSQMFQMVTHHCITASGGPGYLVQPSINSDSHCHENFTYRRSHIKFTESQVQMFFPLIATGQSTIPDATHKTNNHNSHKGEHIPASTTKSQISKNC